jgi:hypothetical protein
MEAGQPKKQIKWGDALLGLVIFLPGLAGAGFDLYNNWLFGLDKSFAIAGTLGIGAIGLVTFPMAIKSWKDAHFIGLTVLCAVLCVFAGYQNHTASEENHALAQAAITERYEAGERAIGKAEDEYRKAKDAAEAIKEPLGSAELQKLYDDAKDQRDKETSAERGGRCGTNCRAAEKVMNATLPRIGDAKAKEAAKAAMDDALGRIKEETDKQPQQAKAAGMSHGERTFFAIVLLLVSVSVATGTHRGWHYLANCVVTIPAPKPRPERKPTAAKPDAAPVETGDGLREFISQGVTATEGEPTVSTAKAYEEMGNWWRVRQNGKPIPSKKAFGDAMTEAGIKRKKVGGKIHYQARLEKQHLLVVKAA